MGLHHYSGKNKKLNLQYGSLLAEVARKMAATKQKNPEQKLRFGASPPKLDICCFVMGPTPLQFDMEPENGGFHPKYGSSPFPGRLIFHLKLQGWEPPRSGNLQGARGHPPTSKVYGRLYCCWPRVPSKAQNGSSRVFA